MPCHRRCCCCNYIFAILLLQVVASVVDMRVVTAKLHSKCVPCSGTLKNVNYFPLVLSVGMDLDFIITQMSVACTHFKLFSLVACNCRASVVYILGVHLKPALVELVQFVRMMMVFQRRQYTDYGDDENDWVYDFSFNFRFNKNVFWCEREI